MHDIVPAEREAIWLGGFDCMARIHRLDVDATGFGFLRRPELGATPLDQELAYYDKYFQWAARGKPQPVIEAAREWLYGGLFEHTSKQVRAGMLEASAAQMAEELGDQQARCQGGTVDRCHGAATTMALAVQSPRRAAPITCRPSWSTTDNTASRMPSEPSPTGVSGVRMGMMPAPPAAASTRSA